MLIGLFWASKVREFQFTVGQAPTEQSFHINDPTRLENYFKIPKIPQENVENHFFSSKMQYFIVGIPSEKLCQLVYGSYFLFHECLQKKTNSLINNL